LIMWLLVKWVSSVHALDEMFDRTYSISLHGVTHPPFGIVYWDMPALLGLYSTVSWYCAYLSKFSIADCR